MTGAYPNRTAHEGQEGCRISCCCCRGGVRPMRAQLPCIGSLCDHAAHEGQEERRCTSSQYTHGWCTTRGRYDHAVARGRTRRGAHAPAKRGQHAQPMRMQTGCRCCLEKMAKGGAMCVPGAVAVTMTCYIWG
eukprot:1143247-Pelagomonas_calceolata.AAC.3